MRKPVIYCLMFVLFPSYVESQSADPPHARHLTESSCSKTQGWMRISTTGIVGDLSCFSAELHGRYASIGGGGVEGRDDVSIQMNFLSRAGTYSCNVPTVLIEFRENRDTWDAYWVGHAKFGDCRITQVFENGRKLWKGHAVASLVIVKGDAVSGSPRFLHTEKDASGNPITKTIKIEWEFNHLVEVPE